MADINYTEAQFTTSGGAVDAEQLRQEFPLPPAQFASTPATVTNVQVFAPGDNPRATLSTDVTLDATDIATALAVVNAHTALGPSDGLTTGEVAAFGGPGRLQNYIRFTEDLDAATSDWTNPVTTVTPNNAVAPNGEMTADLVTWNSVGVGLRQNTSGFITGQVYGVSFWARHVSGNNELRTDIRDAAGSGPIVITTTFEQYHVDIMAGAGGDFIDFSLSGTVGAFEIWGIHVVDRTTNHVHPYMMTEGLAALTPFFGAVVSGDHVVTGDTNTGTLRTGRVTFSADATTEALGRFQVYACDDTSAVRTLTISSSTIADGIPSRPRQIVVRDISGGAGTNNILIVTEGAETIDGEASAVIGANNGVLVLESDGTNLVSQSSNPYVNGTTRLAASRDSGNTTEIYESSDWGTAALAADGNMRVPLKISHTYAIMVSNVVMPLCEIPEATGAVSSSGVNIIGHYRLTTVIVVDTSAPIMWGRDAAPIVLDNVSFVDFSNAGSGLGVTLWDLVGIGGPSGIVTSDTCIFALLKAIGNMVDMAYANVSCQHLFCESGVTSRSNPAFGDAATSAIQLRVGYEGSSLFPNVRRPPLTLIGSTGKSNLNACQVNMADPGNSLIHVDPSVTGNVGIISMGYNGPAADGEFFRPTLVESITAQTIAFITITDFADSAVNPGVDTTCNFGSIVDFTRGQVILIANEAAYNGVHTIVRVAADQMSFDINVVHSTSGAGTLEMVRHTISGTQLARDETVVITGTTNYNGTFQVLRTADNAIWLPQIRVAPDTQAGTATSTGQDETSINVTVALAGAQKESKSIGFVRVTGNATLTAIALPNQWTDLNLGGGAVAGSNIELWGNVDATTGEVDYLGAPPFNGVIRVTASVTSTGGSQTFQFRAFVAGVSTPVAAERDLSSAPKVGVELLIPVQGLLTGEAVRIQVQNTSGSSDILFSHLSMEVS